MKGTEYKHVYVIRNIDNKKFVFTYWPSSQKHKAIFCTRKGAEDALQSLNGNYEIIEL